MPLLIAICAAGAALEAAAVTVAGPGARQLAPQATALGPLAVFHDLRWLLTVTTSWPALLLGSVALVAGRGALLAALGRLTGRDCRPWRRAWASAAAFTAVTALLLSPFVALLYGVALIPFSWPYLAAAPGALIVCLLLSGGGRAGWSQRLPPLRVVAATVADVALLCAGSVVLLHAPPAYAVPLSAAAGAANAGPWLLTATARPIRSSIRPHLPVAPLAAVAFIGVAVAGAWLGFNIRATPQPAQAAAPAAHGRPVLVVAGFGASCCRKAVPLRAPGIDAQQFSYTGLDASGRPRPHNGRATDRALPDLARELATQVSTLHARTGRLVTLVAESEGTLVTVRYLADHPQAPVARALLLSPIIRPHRVSQRATARAELGGVVSVVRRISPFDVRADGPFLASVTRDDLPAAARTVPTTLVLSLADALTLPAHRPDVPVVVVDAFHGGLLGDRSVQRRLRGWLTGRAAPPSNGWPEGVTLLSEAAAAWQVPDQ